MTMSDKPLNDSPVARKDAAMQFLLGRIDYERMLSMPCGEEAFKLDRMRELLRRLGNPEEKLPIVHITGTKGKGSTAAMIASMLTAAGYRTGLFSSPHLDRVEERFTIDGHACSGEELADLVEQVRPAIEALDQAACPHDMSLPESKTSESNIPDAHLPGSSKHGPTYFEIITAMALLHFARQKAQAVILEVGLGGRLDSTNVCQPLLSIITSISFDHTKLLGNTLAAIAGEKAGIIKPGVPVISGVTNDEPREVIRRIAQNNGCRMIEQGIDFDFHYHPALHVEQAADCGRMDFEYGLRYGEKNTMDGIALALLGRHQAGNAAIALAAVEELRRIGWNISETAVREGLAKVVWPARVEVIARHPAVVLDGAHNAASVAALTEVLAESFDVRQRFLIFATTREKDLRGMLGHLLRRFDHVAFTQYLNNPRAVPPEELQALAKEISGKIHPVYADPADAWAAVQQSAASDDLICIAGSFFIAAEMRKILGFRSFSTASD
jgi:dihydrofolate synthase/folylpolyglutamate synthase